MSPVLEVTLPVFAIVGCGLAAARLRMLSEEAVTGLNAFVFWFALPMMLMRAVAGLDLRAVLDLRLFVAYLGCSLAMFAAVFAIARGSGLQRTSSALNSTHGNVGYLGLALIAQIASQTGEPTLLAPAILIVLVDIGGLIVVALVLFEVHAARARAAGSVAGSSAGSNAGRRAGSVAAPDGGRRAAVRAAVRTIAAVLRSPLVLGIAAGAALSLTGWRLPGVVDRYVDLMASAAAPCALFAIGAAFGERKLHVNRDVAIQVGIKLLVYPLAVAAAMQLAGVPPVQAAVATVVAALPAASNSFILARRYGADTTALSAATVLGTAIAVVTVSAAIGWFGLVR